MGRNLDPETLRVVRDAYGGWRGSDRPGARLMIRRLLRWALSGSLGYVPVTDSRMEPADAFTQRQRLSECGPAKVETAADRVRRRLAQEQQAHQVTPIRRSA